MNRKLVQGEVAAQSVLGGENSMQEGLKAETNGKTFGMAARW